jgi:hypothetical protein
MAQRRMFSKTITSSARFLKMPKEVQNLYFHLCMHADDDGIVEAFTVMQILGSEEDSIKLLAVKGFVKPLNEDLVTYIMDWREHNLIRPDRKIDSIYKDLLLQLVPEAEIIKPRPRADTKKISSGRPMDNQWTAQDRLGKDRLGKVSLDKNTITSNEVSQIIEYFNSLFSTKFRVTPERSKKIKLRLKTYTIDEIKKAIYNLSKSKFHNGENDRGWRATIDFITRNDEKIDEFLNSSPAKIEDIIITKKPYFMGKPLSKDMKFVIWSKGDIREFAGDKKDIVWK